MLEQRPTRESAWEELMKQSQEGDADAYYALLAELSVVLSDFVKQRVASAVDVDDVVQEILLALHQSRHTYDPHRAFAPWMYGIARYKIADYFRRFKRRQAREDLLDRIDTAAVQEGREEDLTNEVLKALKELPKKQRRIVELMKLKGLSVKEVAKREGMSESAVKVTAHRAYRFLRMKFED